MRVLTEDAVLPCQHENGLAQIVPTQVLARIDGRHVLVAKDPEGRPIVGCPMSGPGVKPCTMTLPATDGYSSLVRIDGRRVCLDTVIGLTDGTPPGTIKYTVRRPGQALVASGS